MEPLVRKQISLTRAQALALRERARREHLSEEDLLRRAVERLLGAEPPATMTAADDLVKYIRAVEEANPSEPRGPGEDRGWTRNELYDERLSRWIR